MAGVRCGVLSQPRHFFLGPFFRPCQLKRRRPLTKPKSFSFSRWLSRISGWIDNLWWTTETQAMMSEYFDLRETIFFGHWIRVLDSRVKAAIFREPYVIYFLIPLLSYTFKTVHILSWKTVSFFASLKQVWAKNLSSIQAFAYLTLERAGSKLKLNWTWL